MTASVQPDHFGLFGLPARFRLDPAALDAAFLRVQSLVHPDRFAAGSATERRVAMQWATRANEAFQTLKSPVRRAAYLCELHGVPLGSETNTAMPTAFLVQQLQWREALQDTLAPHCALDQLHADTEREYRLALEQVADAIDSAADFTQAAGLVRQLMFIEKFRQELAAHNAREAAAEPKAT